MVDESDSNGRRIQNNFFFIVFISDSEGHSRRRMSRIILFLPKYRLRALAADHSQKRLPSSKE